MHDREPMSEMPHDHARLRRKLVSHVVSTLPTCIAGNLLAVLLTGVVAFADRGGPHWLTWILVQGLANAATFTVYLVRTRARRLSSPKVARWALRGVALGSGLAWLLGAYLWPLESGDAGLCVLLCIAILTAGGSSAWSADPRGLLFFTVPALLPYVLAERGSWWLSLLASAFLLASTTVSFVSHRLLRTTLGLHWSNEELLRQALHEREAARELQLRAEQAAESRTRFLAAASHDLRQPVQALTLFADVLCQDPAEPQRVAATAAVARTAGALSAMLEGLLDLSRLDAGVTSNVVRGVGLQPLIYDTAAALTDEAEVLGVQLRVSAVDCDVLADPALLVRVVQNLASNAVRHAGRGRVLLSARRRGSGHCLFQVWDQGPGIAAADQQRVFEEFVQLGNPERDRQKGLGLGLSMVQRICRFNSWPLRLESRLGRGSVFSVLLPIAPAVAPSTREPVVGDEAELRVMLVEDDRVVRTALTQWLKACGCRVDAFSNAASAISAFERIVREGSAIDVLVNDHGLPGPMTGADLFHALRARQADLPTVVLTGAVKAPLGDRPPPRSTVLRKPVSGRVLWEAIQHVVREPA